jgi:hypothetical protein
MLERETKNEVEWEDKVMSEKIIEWSPTGCAFRILNISLFSNYILPKYFRTKNFSSFQRNLNLVSNWLTANCSSAVWLRSHLLNLLPYHYILFSTASLRLAEALMQICTFILHSSEEHHIYSRNC